MKPLAAAVAGLLLAPALGASDEAVALVRRIEAHHRAVLDLTARFTQTYRSGVLGRELVERGTLWVKRPGRMLWEYEEPEKKLFVCDGRSYYFYVPADRQVIVRDQAADRRAPALLLAGEGGILDRFDATLEGASADGRRLRLTPREADPEMESVYLEVDTASRITSIEVLDAQGNRSRFRFERIRENVGVGDERFRFKIPRGVEVVEG